MATSKIPRISDTEWEIMQALWAGSPAAANEIIERLLAKDRSWHPKTVKTLLTRLVQKGAVRYEAQGRSYLYRPALSEQQCVTAVSTSFLDRVFGGSLKPLLAHFVESRRLTRTEIAELKQLLETEPGKLRKK